MEGVPNAFAYLVLGAYPLIALAFFMVFKPSRACTVCMLVGALFLPANIAIDPPVVPPLDKESIPGLAALLGCAFFAPARLKAARPFRGPDWIVWLLLFSTFFTTVTNRDPIIVGPVTLPGETTYDFFAATVKLLLRWWVPFYVGRAMVTSSEELRDFVRLLVLAGIGYSLLILLEIRLSPQLNMWIYGYHQSQWAQTMRWGGYRPKVFMRHGLNVALFVVMTLIAAAALKRMRMKVLSLGAGVWVAYLGVILVLCKSAGAIVYALVLLPIALFSSPRKVLLAASIIATIEITYPLLRAFGWIPTDAIVDFFHDKLGEERALSLWFRFDTEQQILTRAMERFAFGWGGYGRPMIYDMKTGEAISIIDGFWAYEIGSHGLVGFLGIFGLLLLPIRYLRKQFKYINTDTTQKGLAILALMVSLYAMDLIPNASVHQYLTYMVGVLTGALFNIPRQESQAQAAPQISWPFAVPWRPSR